MSNKKKLFVSRYTPKYKVLLKFRQAIWLDKRRKICRFNRQKWENLKRFYFPRRLRKFDQDRGSCFVGDDFFSDRATRLRKVYKQLLRDKQALQLYYGGKRFDFTQLKSLAKCSKKLGSGRDVSFSKVFFHLLENRVEVALVRMGFVRSLIQSRRLLSTFCVKVGRDFVENFGYRMTVGSSLRLDSLKSLAILSGYLKFNYPFFYFRSKEDCKTNLLNKKRFFKVACFYRDRYDFLLFIKQARGCSKKV